jgi:hypothetical protein
VAEGRKSNNSGGLTYQPGERELSDYYPKPYWGVDRAIPVTCNDPNVVKISSSGDPLDWTEVGTITVSGNCTEYDSVYSACTTSVNDCVSGKTYTDAANIAVLSTSLKEEA